MSCYPKKPNNSWEDLSNGVPCVCGGAVTVDWESWFIDEEGFDGYEYACSSRKVVVEVKEEEI